MPYPANVVAIIDRDEVTRERLEIVLSALAYEVELYESAEAFLAGVGDSEARCLLVDLELGGISGIQLGRGLAAAGFRFPIIYMTATTDTATRKRAMEAGGVAFLHKPCPPRAVDEALKAAKRRTNCC
jgi:FixJ family two-component response regulator